MRYSDRYARPIPFIGQPEFGDGRGTEFEVCPGKGVDILRLSAAVSSQGASYDPKLGFVHGAWATHSNRPQVLRRASSGGIMTEIPAYLLATGRVRGVVATKLMYGAQGPFPQTIIAESLQELLECQGSKYLPIAACQILESLETYDGYVVFVGTPCQIEGLRMLQERFDFIAKVRYVVGSFCGGVKDYRALTTTIRRQGMDPAEVVEFRHRGGGQPGSMLMEDDAGRHRQRPYPDYEADTGYPKLERCRLCIDGTAELADFACGDAWLDRFLSSGTSWSIVITRNEAATEIVNEMIERDLVTVSHIGLDEIAKSQSTNLYSKKTRQAARRRLYKMMGKPTPQYDGGFSDDHTSLLVELKVHLSHSLRNLLERLHLYSALMPVVRNPRHLIRRRS